ncbi:hypothetical protein LOB52_02330 [Lactobacillus delbrueckii subsp. bulgaricus]|uniref:hypothetical protein n=1 Tax=Lactobacillus delbrueckii TaxID=1584 RepID=UPI001E352954|nr:hypothetical protein [Lactobacillus delbrueckii]MCD5461509.1 hypothetical protein [Lactobacillus delbrueckii subsp. bulgaricus]
MKKSQLILRKSLCSLAAIISLVALLSSPVTFKMYEVKDYASSLIDTFANQSDGSTLLPTKAMAAPCRSRPKPR